MDGLGNIAIFIESLSRIEAAIQRRSFARQFHRDKIGEGCLFALDESKGMLAVYSSARVRPSFCLFAFVYDQILDRCNFISFRSRTSVGPCEGWDPQSTFVRSITTGRPLSTRASSMVAKKSCSWTPVLKREYFP